MVLMLCEIQLPHPGFDLESLCLFPTTITIPPHAPPYLYSNNFHENLFLLYMDGQQVWELASYCTGMCKAKQTYDCLVVEEMKQINIATLIFNIGSSIVYCLIIFQHNLLFGLEFIESIFDIFTNRIFKIA